MHYLIKKMIFLIIFVTFSYPLASLAQFNKRYIQLGREIQLMAICKEKALVQIEKNRKLSTLLSIDLSTLKQTIIKTIPKGNNINCDDTSGRYYIVDGMDESTLSSFSQLEDEEPKWQFKPEKTTLGKIAIADKYVLVLGKKDKSNYIFMLDKLNGNLIKETVLPPKLEAIGAIELNVIQNKLYLSYPRHYIFSYDIETLTMLWERRLSYQGKYSRPIYDLKSKMLVFALEQSSDSSDDLAEVVGLDPRDGATAWTIIEKSGITMSKSGNSVIYLQDDHIFYTLNWYSVKNNKPYLSYQWRDLVTNYTGYPYVVNVINNNTYLTFNMRSDEGPKQIIYVFNGEGEKIDQIVFENQEWISLRHSERSNITIYAASNGEFGILGLLN